MIARAFARLLGIRYLEYEDYAAALEELVEVYVNSMRQRDLSGLRHVFGRMRKMAPAELEYQELHIRAIYVVKWECQLLKARAAFSDESRGDFARLGALNHIGHYAANLEKAIERLKEEYSKLPWTEGLESAHLFWQVAEEIAEQAEDRERRAAS